MIIVEAGEGARSTHGQTLAQQPRNVDEYLRGKLMQLE